MTKDTTWLKLPLGLLQEELSLSTKVIYAYMLWRYVFFRAKAGGTYFESQDTIAKACSVSRKTVNEGIQSLSCAGLLTYKKSTSQSHTYILHDKFGVYTIIAGQDVDEDVF